jgi:hypothetical protein
MINYLKVQYLAIIKQYVQKLISNGSYHNDLHREKITSNFHKIDMSVIGQSDHIRKILMRLNKNSFRDSF